MRNHADERDIWDPRLMAGGPGGPGRGRGRGPRGRGHRGDWREFTDERAFTRGARAARGDIRTAILVLLAEEPMHGYQIIQEVQERSNGTWQPSPGSIYPRLQALQDEGLVSQAERSGKKVFTLTDEGRAAFEAVPVAKRAPWDDLSEGVGSEAFAMRRLVGQLIQASQQVARFGTDNQIRDAKDALDAARKRIYAILAEEDETT